MKKTKNKYFKKPQIAETVREFTKQIFKVRDSCILNAMANGIDLHEMQLHEKFETKDNIVIYSCKVIRKNDDLGHEGSE